MRDHVGLQASNMLFHLTQPPRALRVLGRISLGAMLTAGLFLFAPWQQVAPASGRVVAFSAAQRQQVVEAPLDGRVVSIYGEVSKIGRTSITIAGVGTSARD